MGDEEREHADDGAQYDDGDVAQPRIILLFDHGYLLPPCIRNGDLRARVELRRRASFRLALAGC